MSTLAQVHRLRPAARSIPIHCSVEDRIIAMESYIIATHTTMLDPDGSLDLTQLSFDCPPESFKSGIPLKPEALGYWETYWRCDPTGRQSNIPYLPSYIIESLLFYREETDPPNHIYLCSYSDEGIEIREQVRRRGWFRAIFRPEREKTEATATWNLARLCTANRVYGVDGHFSTDFPYRFSSSAGKGVDIYVIDSGINLKHNDFQGAPDRTVEFSFVAPYDSNWDDSVGHGSWCAGIAGGNLSGVAKKANIIAVKAYNNDSDMFASYGMLAIDWVTTAVISSQRPSVISFSIGWKKGNYGIDESAKAAVDHGVHFVAAAGNFGDDVGVDSPAHLDEVITVGATTIDDEKWSGSCYGSAVDIFAPGKNVLGPTKDGVNNWLSESGTSASAPIVAGQAAVEISQLGYNPTPKVLKSKLNDFSHKNRLFKIPSGTANRLVYNHPPFSAGVKENSE